MMLREAAQQALEAMEKNTKHLPLHFDNYFEAMYALRAALAEPVQEPVAEVVEDEFSRQVVGIGQWLKLPNGTKLYTTPPKRKPLTEEEIIDAVRDADLDWARGWALDETQGNRFATLARAIERAHGIGGEA